MKAMCEFGTKYFLNFKSEYIETVLNNVAWPYVLCNKPNWPKLKENLASEGFFFFASLRGKNQLELLFLFPSHQTTVAINL